MVKQIHAQLVILASRSPRRIELLKQINVDSIVIPADIDESVLLNESPITYVKRVAKQKVVTIAKDLKSEYRHLPVLAADTTVVLDKHILGKPANDAEAMEMLKLLSGTTHLVHTAVAVSYQNKVKVVVSSTQVEMIKLSNAMISAYIATGEPRDKAGSYAIQGRAGAWIKHIQGSYTGVMGLPLFETTKLLTSI